MHQLRGNTVLTPRSCKQVGATEVINVTYCQLLYDSFAFMIEMVSLLQTVDTSHEDMIHDAQMDYYGIRLATCSSDKSIKVFDVKEGTPKLLSTLIGHEGPVWQVAWAHPMYGNLIASCSYDRKVILWKESGERWEQLHVYNDHDSSVNSLCWAPYQYGLLLACGSSDGAISVLLSSGDGHWTAKKIHNAHTIGCNAVSWEPTIATGSTLDPPSLTSTKKSETSSKRFVTGGCDNLVKIWKYNETDEEWIEDQKLEAHSDWVRDVAWAPTVGLTRNMIASCSQDRRVIIWTCENDEEWIPRTLNTFDDVVWHVSWSVTGHILAVSGGDNKVSLWKESLDGHWSCISDINKGPNVQNLISEEHDS